MSSSSPGDSGKNAAKTNGNNDAEASKTPQQTAGASSSAKPPQDTTAGSAKGSGKKSAFITQRIGIFEQVKWHSILDIDLFF